MSSTGTARGREAVESPCRQPDFLTPLEYPSGELNAPETVTPAHLISGMSGPETASAPALTCDANGLSASLSRPCSA